LRKGLQYTLGRAEKNRDIGNLSTVYDPTADSLILKNSDRVLSDGSQGVERRLVSLLYCGEDLQRPRKKEQRDGQMPIGLSVLSSLPSGEEGQSKKGGGTLYPKRGWRRHMKGFNPKERGRAGL